MRLALYASYGPGSRRGWDAVHAAVALSQHADVQAVPTDPLPPGPYPAQFRDLLAGKEPHVRVLLGDPADRPLASPSMVWAYPGHYGGAADGWDAVIATNRDAATDLNTADVAPLGVTVDGFDYRPRRNRGVISIGQKRTLPGEQMWRDPDQMTERGLAYVFRMCAVGVCTDPRHAWAAARFMATGGCLIAPPVDDLANLVHPDWSIPLPSLADSTIAAAVNDALDHPGDTLARGRLAADYIRTGLSWTTCTERMMMLTRRHL